MISFRVRPPIADDWDSVSFTGEHEDLLSHSFARTMLAAGWEILVTEADEEESLLDDTWL